VIKETIQNEKAELNISLGKANYWFFIIWIIMVFDYVDRMDINAVLPLSRIFQQFSEHV